MGLLDRLKGRQDAARRVTALVVQADPGAIGDGIWDAELVLRLEDGATARVAARMTRERWLLPGERVPVCVRDGVAEVDWAALPPLEQRALAGDRPFTDPDGSAAERQEQGPLAPFDPAAAPPEPGLPEVLPDGRLRGRARVLASAGHDDDFRLEAWSIAVPGHRRWGTVQRFRERGLDVPPEGLPVGVRPDDPHDVEVLWDDLLAVPEPPPPAPLVVPVAAAPAPPRAAGALMEQQLAQLHQMRASGVLPAAIATQMEAALKQQMGSGH